MQDASVAPQIPPRGAPRFEADLVALVRDARARMEEIHRLMHALCYRFRALIPRSRLKLDFKYRRDRSIVGMYWRVLKVIRSPDKVKHRSLWIYHITHAHIFRYTSHYRNRHVFDLFERQRARLSDLRARVSRALVTARAIAVLYKDLCPALPPGMLDFPFTLRDQDLLRGLVGLGRAAAALESELTTAIDQAAQELAPCGIIPRLKRASQLGVLSYCYWGIRRPDGYLNHIPRAPTEQLMRMMLLTEKQRDTLRRHRQLLRTLKRRRDLLMRHILAIRRTIQAALEPQPTLDVELYHATALPPEPPPAAWHDHPATPRQLQALERLGQPIPDGLTKRQAQLLLWQLVLKQRKQRYNRGADVIGQALPEQDTIPPMPDQSLAVRDDSREAPPTAASGS